MSKGRILVVDDVATYRTMLGEALAAKDYEIIYASNGLEAIQIIKAEMSRINLVLLDLLMPKMTGFDALKEIRQLEGGQDLPVIVITGLFKTIEDKMRLRNLGAMAFLDKSRGIEDALSTIINFLHPQWEDKVEHQIPAKVLVTYKVGEKPFSAYTHTIGTEGMFIQTSNVAPPGTDVKIRFRLDEEGEAITVTGKIVFVASASDHSGGKKLPPGIEVDFTEIAPEQKAALKEWLQKKAVNPESPKCTEEKDPAGK